MFCWLLYVRHPIEQEVGEQREQSDWDMGRYEDVVPAVLLPNPCCIRQIKRRELYIARRIWKWVCATKRHSGTYLL